MLFGELIHHFISDYLPRLSAPTRAKYHSLLNKHVVPEFGRVEVDEIGTRSIDGWLARKSHEGLSWATRTALRNLVCSIFTRAEIWEEFDGKNPAKNANPGKQKAVYDKRKLSVEDTKRLLAELPEDARIVCMVALFCGLRISEVMGLCWKHIDFERGMVLIRQRYWRGDIDTTKSEKSSRDIPFGELSDLLQSLYPGPEACDEFCFSVKTKSVKGVTRDDRSMRRYFLQPAAKRLGVYYKGFGFHALRREAITAVGKEAGVMQASNFAGHSNIKITSMYVLQDKPEQEKAVRKIQEPFKKAGLLKAAKHPKKSSTNCS